MLNAIAAVIGWGVDIKYTLAKFLIIREFSQTVRTAQATAAQHNSTVRQHSTAAQYGSTAARNDDIGSRSETFYISHCGLES